MPTEDSPRRDAIVAPGDIVGDKYEVIRVLGSGGMGIVVAARHLQLGKMVAIKLLRRDMFARERSRARFEREGRVLATLVSEHVAKVHDIGSLATGEPFIVMDLLEGETLGHRLRRVERLTVTEAVTIALHACEALAEAHAAGVVHRDLKPDNLFICKRLDDTEIIKLIDFGISKADEETAITQVSELIGTPAYTAPEQLEAPGTVDPRADVWSLGAVLYESLSGRRPFEAPGVMRLMSAILKTDPTPIGERAPGLPEGLGEVIHACLAKDRAKRIASVRELARRLAPFVPEDTASLMRIESIERNRASNPSIAPPTVRRARPSVDAVPDAAVRPTPRTSEDTSAPIPSSLKAAPSAAKSWTQTLAIASRRRVLTYGLGVAGAAVLAIGAGLMRGARRSATASDAAAADDARAMPVMLGPPLRVGVLHSLTGTMASSESGLVDAILLAIARVNAAGGLLGRPVVPMVRDGRSRADDFVTEARRLLDEDGVEVVFGCWTSTSRRAVRPFFEARNRLLFYSVQYEGLEASPAIVYLGAAPNQQLIPAVRWAFAFLERRSFFLVGSDYVFPRVAHEILRDQVRALGARIAGETFLPLGAVDVSAVVEKIKKSGATAILNTINGDTNVAFIRALRAAGVRSDAVPLLSFSLDEPGYRGLDASLVSGDYMAWSYFESFDSAENAEFLRALHERFGPLHPATDPMATSYSAVLLWAEAVRRAGAVDATSIRNALPSLRVATPLGELRVDAATGHAVKGIAIGRIGSDGKPRVVWTAPAPITAVPYPDTRPREAWEKLLTDLQREWGGRWEAPLP